MKFSPRALPTADADASSGQDRHPLRELALLLAGVGLLAAGLYLVVVMVAELVIRNSSPATEARWFGFYQDLLPSPENLPPELAQREATAQRQLERLLPHADLEGLPVQLRLWDEDSTNAVALPGGTIALSTGLLRALDEEPALAFVLAHELGHFHGRDHLRGLSHQLGWQASLTLLCGGEVILRGGASQVAALAGRAYSRERESAADRYALRLVHQALGGTAGSTRLFELLQKEQLPAWAYMFQTHPAPADRQRALQQLARDLAQQQPTPQP